MRLALAVCVLVVLNSAPHVLAQDSPVGNWKGAMTREGADVEIEFELRAAQGHFSGTFSSRQQRILDYPFTAVSYSAPKLHIDLAGGDTVFDGTLQQGRLEGTFREQGAGAGTFHLSRFTPTPPPYTSENVNFKNGDVTLAGSLYVPKTRGQHPAILFLHGSGPETRWGANRFWADYFARGGVAALIYDKRGSGESTGNWETADFNDLAGDAVAGIHLLEQRPPINGKQIGIYGHSQGGSLAPLVAAKSGSVGFVISSAGTGISMFESELYSWHQELQSQGLTGKTLKNADEFLRRAAEFVASGDHGREKWITAQNSERSQPWYKFVDPPLKDSEFWSLFPRIANYDPSEYWRQLHVPALIIQAGDDNDVPTERSVAAIRRALSSAAVSDYTILLLPGAPHTFIVHAKSGQPFHWPYLYHGYADLLVAWVRYRTIDHQ